MIYSRKKEAALNDRRTLEHKWQSAARRAGVALAGAALALSSAGCLGNDAVVFVEPTITDATLTVSSVVLGTDVKGSFRLHLLLGPRASGASQVSLQSFSLNSVATSMAIVDPLKTSTDTSFPVTVAVDSETSALLNVDLGGALLPETAYVELCDAAGLKIMGTIQDSLSSGATPVASDPIKPSGCP